MYSILKTRVFKKSYNKLILSGVKELVINDLKSVIDTLSHENSLPAGYSDHSLKGDYLGYRDCHIKGDLILIYKIEKNNLILVLVNIGSHSELF